MSEVSVHQSLAALARKAAGQPFREAQYDFLEVEYWSTTREGLRTGAAARHTHRRSWIALNGSGRIEEFRDGLQTRASHDYAPGGIQVPAWRSATMGEDIASLLSPWLPDSTPFGLAELFQLVWTSSAVPPPVAEQLLRMLSSKLDGGEARYELDSAGRTGLTLNLAGRGYRGAPETRKLLLAENSGRLLEYQRTAPAGEEQPRELERTTMIQSSTVDALGSVSVPSEG